MDKREVQPRSPFILITLYAPISTTRTSFCSSSTFNINPLQNLVLPRTYNLPQCNHWRNKNQKQQLRFSTISTHHLLKMDQERRKTCLALFSNFPSYRVFHHRILHTSIECHNFLNHPLLIVDLFHIIHNQTKFPTHAHVSLKQSLQSLTNNDGISFARQHAKS